MPATTAKPTDHLHLLLPQARVLKALLPDDDTSHWTEWPELTRAEVNKRAGFTPISGTTTRALNGIRKGSSSGEPHPGLVDRGLVKCSTIELEVGVEQVYRITAAGIRAIRAYLEEHGRMPNRKNKESCVNLRYAVDAE